MRHLSLLLCLLLSFGIAACRQEKKAAAKKTYRASGTMNVTIRQKIRFREIPSASGMEVIGDKLYVVGDDSPFLYVLDVNSFELLTKIKLFDTRFFLTGRIPKALKPDLESLTTVEMGGEKYLVAFGSGSSPNRTKCYTVKLPDQAGAVPEVKEYSLKALYIALQQNEGLMTGDLLNLEGAAATTDGKLLLLQRSVNTGPNAVLSFDTRELLHYLRNQSPALPTFTTTVFELPELGNLQARFSGAFAFQEKLFFTASVENTNDAILDGEVLGSFIGWMPLADLTPGTKPVAAQHTAFIPDQDGEPYPGKVESLVIQEEIKTGTYRGLAITDNDNGESELLVLEISL